MICCYDICLRYPQNSAARMLSIVQPLAGSIRHLYASALCVFNVVCVEGLEHSVATITFVDCIMVPLVYLECIK